MYTLLVILSMISLVSGAAVAKSLFEVLGAESTSVLRLAAAALLLSLFWRPWKQKLAKDQLTNILLYGGCLGLMNFTFYLSIQRLPIALAIAIEFLGPLAIAILHSRKLVDFIWILLASLGILLILPLSNVNSDLDPIGILYALIAAGFWAFYIKQGQKTASKVPPSIAIPMGMFFGFLVTLPFGFKNIGIAFTNTHILLSVLAVGLLSSAIPYSLEFIALKKLPPKNFSLLLSLEPAIGALGALIFLNERLNTTEMIAIACVIAASVGSTLSSKFEKKKPQDQLG